MCNELWQIGCRTATRKARISCSLDDILHHKLAYAPKARSFVGTVTTYRDKQVGHLSFVLSPSLAVVVTTALDISCGTVSNHASKEDGIEPRKRAVETRDKAPVQCKPKIARIVDLASLAICSEVSNESRIY